jgi:hypothetical protein
MRAGGSSEADQAHVCRGSDRMRERGEVGAVTQRDFAPVGSVIGGRRPVGSPSHEAAGADPGAGRGAAVSMGWQRWPERGELGAVTQRILRRRNGAGRGRQLDSAGPEPGRVLTARFSGRCRLRGIAIRHLREHHERLIGSRRPSHQHGSTTAIAQ